MSESHDDLLPGWVADALQQPIASPAAARERIMSAVRAGPAPAMLMKPMPSRWARRGVLSMAGALTALVAL
nr:hypothetical protein [Gemmatimonadaceae bacterium]